MIKKFGFILLTLLIPMMLFFTVWQTSRYSLLEKEVAGLNRTQYDIISVNKRYISGISVLSSPERIEKVAVEDLSMRKARADEIVRISLGRRDLGG